MGVPFNDERFTARTRGRAGRGGSGSICAARGHRGPRSRRRRDDADDDGADAPVPGARRYLTRAGVAYIRLEAHPDPPALRGQARDVLALGAVAAKTLLAINDSMSNLRGRWYEFRPTGARSNDPNWSSAKLAVTYHPAFLLRDPKEAGSAMRAIFDKVAKTAPSGKARTAPP